MQKYFLKDFVLSCVKINIFPPFFVLQIAFCDSIHTNIDFIQWQKRMQFTPQQKACATCDFTIAFPLQDLTQEDIFAQDALFSNQTPHNKAVKDTDLLMQNSALQNLFGEDLVQESQQDSTQYTFLGQRQHEISLENMAPYKNTQKNISLSKSIFMKTDIPHAYETMLKHKGVFSCMYCGNLDKIATILPFKKTQITHHNVHYLYIPLKDSYHITISDTICGTIDNLIFIQDKDSVELWVYSYFKCKQNSPN